MTFKKLAIWLGLEMTAVGAVLAQTPTHAVPSAAPSSAVSAAAPGAAGAAVAPTGTAKKSGGRTTSALRNRSGVTPTVIVDPNALAGGGYAAYAAPVPAPQAPIPSPFPASAKGKNGRNVISTETVTSDSVR